MKKRSFFSFKRRSISREDLSSSSSKRRRLEEGKIKRRKEMGNNRFGEGMNLTPTEARERLSIPVLWILLNLAEPIFTDSTRSSPSALVRIQATKNQGSIVSIIGIPFMGSPVVLNSLQWEKGILPVLIDPSVDPTTPLNQNLIKNDLPTYMLLLGTKLQDSFKNAGFG